MHELRGVTTSLETKYSRRFWSDLSLTAPYSFWRMEFQKFDFSNTIREVISQYSCRMYGVDVNTRIAWVCFSSFIQSERSPVRPMLIARCWWGLVFLRPGRAPLQRGTPSWLDGRDCDPACSVLQATTYGRACAFDYADGQSAVGSCRGRSSWRYDGRSLSG